jgi:NitT/TauT family transport system permease protein
MTVTSDAEALKAKTGKDTSVLRLLSRYANWVYVPISLGFVVLVWWLVTIYFDPPSYVLPSPQSVYRALRAGILVNVTSRESFFYHLAGTLQGTFYGFVVGGTIGIVLGALIAEFVILENFLFPYVVGLQSLPKVALAPLVVIWFGFGLKSKVALAALITFFPLVINTYSGLKSVDPDRLELMRSLLASRWKTFRMVKFPSAMPFVVAGLDMAIVYALLGTIVAEFVGAQKGIGVLILVLGSVNDTAGVFASLIVLGLTGFLLHATFRIIKRRLLFWVQQEEEVISA